MIPVFETFLKFRTRRLPDGARPFWDEVSSLRFSPAEVQMLDRIETVRRRIERDDRALERVDFGAGSRRMSSTANIEVGRFARRASVSRRWGRLLFKIARTAESRRVLELGTCVGLSAAYLQAAVDLSGGGLLVTIEGDPALCALARETLASVTSNPGTVVEGRFSDVLESVLQAYRPFDLVFVDGHHDPAAVEGYVNMIVPHISEGAIVMMDDIQPLTGPVRKAWKVLTHGVPSSWSVDLVRMGVLRTEPAQ